MVFSISLALLQFCFFLSFTCLAALLVLQEVACWYLKGMVSSLPVTHKSLRCQCPMQPSFPASSFLVACSSENPMSKAAVYLESAAIERVAKNVSYVVIGRVTCLSKLLWKTGYFVIPSCFSAAGFLSSISDWSCWLRPWAPAMW